MLKPGKDVIIFKITVKKATASGIVIPGKDGTKLIDKFFIDGVEAFLVGENITIVKPGQKVVLTNRPMLPLDIEQYLGEEKSEERMYSKGKEEDIVCVIE